MRQKTENKIEETKSVFEVAEQKREFMNVGVLVLIWIALLVLVVSTFIFSQLSSKSTNPVIETQTFQIISIIINFSALIMSTLFSISVLNHNAMSREMNIETRRISDNIKAHEKEYRVLQFNSANLSVIEFVDYMLISRERESYVKQLKETKDFSSYMREDGIDINDVIENMSDYAFRTIKLPIMLIEGKAISKINFRRFEFIREDGITQFVPAVDKNIALIIYNESEKRSEAIVNIILKKTSGFYAPQSVIPCKKIKIDLNMQSLLGVSIKGRVELYFTNPKKLESDGANKYTINSSQFEIMGLPELTINKAE